jgi:cytochrome b561
MSTTAPQDADAVSTRRYTRTVIVLHWMIAALIVWQIASGVWMVPAIDDPARWERAFQLYQLHKSMGLTVLALSLVRLIWRLGHAPPPLPAGVLPWQRRASRVVHAMLYGLMIAVPLAGWLVVSSSPLGLPTLLYGWFEWPHLPLSPALEPTAKTTHRLLAYALGVLAAGHVAAALKHQIVDRQAVLQRMSLRRQLPG